MTWLHIFDYPYRILIIDDSGSEKTNACAELNKTSSSGCLQNLFLH